MHTQALPLPTAIDTTTHSPEGSLQLDPRAGERALAVDHAPAGEASETGELSLSSTGGDASVTGELPLGSTGGEGTAP